MRVLLEMDTYGIPQTDIYPDEEIIYYKVFNMWLRVHFSHIWYFEYDTDGEITFSEPSTAILSVKEVVELPNGVESLRCQWIHDAQYDLKRTQLGVPIRKRILHHAANYILGGQSPGYAQIEI